MSTKWLLTTEGRCDEITAYADAHSEKVISGAAEFYCYVYKHEGQKLLPIEQWLADVFLTEDEVNSLLDDDPRPVPEEI